MALTAEQLDAMKNALKGVGNNFGSGAAIGQPTTGDMSPDNDTGFTMKSPAGSPTDSGFYKEPPAGTNLADPGFNMKATTDYSGSIVHAPGPGEGPASLGYIAKGPGGVGTGGQVGTGTGMGTGAGKKTDSAAINDTDPYMTKAKAGVDALDKLVKTPFTYDPNTDPAYASLKDINTKNTIGAKRSTQDEMDARGIGNSSNNAERMYEIDKQSADATTAAIPQLQAAAYNRHQTDISNQQGLVNAYTGISNTQNARDLQQATISGRFWPQGAKPLVDAIMADKRSWASATPEQQKAIAADAQTKRDMLGQYGIDPSLFGADVGLDQALANEGYGAGIETQASKAARAALIMGIGDRYATMPDGIGNAIAGLGGDYTSTGGLLNSLKGVPNANYLINSMKNLIAKQRADAATTSADARVISANKAGQGNAIAAEHLQLDKDKIVTDKQKEDEKIRLEKTTQGEIAEALNSKTREDAYIYVVDHRQALSDRGVDIDKMIKAIDTSNKWGKKPAATGTFEAQMATQ